MFDLGIMNGKVYTSGYWYEGHLYIKDGKINALTQEKPICKNTYDAKGLWVLPVFIDPHVHLGIEGLVYSFSIMFYRYGEAVIDKFTRIPAKTHGLYPNKGLLKPGADADIVILNPYKSWLPSTGIYQDVPMKGQVISTICRGKFIIDNGEFVGKMGYGNYLERELKIN